MTGALLGPLQVVKGGMTALTETALTETGMTVMIETATPLDGTVTVTVTATGSSTPRLVRTQTGGIEHKAVTGQPDDRVGRIVSYN